MDMLRIGILGIVGILLAVQLKGTKPEYSVYISIATSLVIFFYAARRLEIIIQAIQTIQSFISVHSAYIGTLVKIIGITYISEFSSAICKDAGHATIASQIEVFSKLAILAVSMPILLALLETIKGFLAA